MNYEGKFTIEQNIQKSYTKDVEKNIANSRKIQENKEMELVEPQHHAEKLYIYREKQ